MHGTIFRAAGGGRWGQGPCKGVQAGASSLRWEDCPLTGGFGKSINNQGEWEPIKASMNVERGGLHK